MSAAALRGLVALGDSVTRGSGEAMLGMRMQSWALWLAEALSLPYTNLAADGARAADALREQAPRLNGPYELGCLYIGLNDVRSTDWDAEAFERDLPRLAAAVAEQARALLLVRLPAELGVPPAPAEAIARANHTIDRAGAEQGAAVLATDAVAGFALVQPDAVHLTARGEARLALLAARCLQRRGFAPRLDELERALEPLDARSRARYALGAYARAQVRDWGRRAVEAAQRARA